MTKPDYITEELFQKVINNGILTRLKNLDDKITHYFVIDSNKRDISICFNHPSWFDEYSILDTRIYKLKWIDLDKRWFVKENN